MAKVASLCGKENEKPFTHTHKLQLELAFQPPQKTFTTYLIDGFQDVIGKASNSPSSFFLEPLLFLDTVELVAPKSLHQLSLFNLELTGIKLGKVFQSESPAMES